MTGRSENTDQVALPEARIGWQVYPSMFLVHIASIKHHVRTTRFPVIVLDTYVKPLLTQNPTIIAK